MLRNELHIVFRPLTEMIRVLADAYTMLLSGKTLPDRYREVTL
jgi:hypothetical protein